MALLIEQKKFQEVDWKAGQPSISEIEVASFDKRKKQMEYERIMGVDYPFSWKMRFWMRQFCKFRMQNSKKQGFTKIDWEKFEVMKRR